jgi:hypothetical protein
MPGSLIAPPSLASTSGFDQGGLVNDRAEIVALCFLQLDDGETVSYWEKVPAPDRTPVEALTKCRAGEFQKRGSMRFWARIISSGSQLNLLRKRDS